MLKTRSLNSRFYGRSDSLGLAYGQWRNGLQLPSSMEDKLATDWTHYYGMAMASAQQMSAAPQGFEKFISTENKYRDNDCIHIRRRAVNLPYTSVYKAYWSYPYFMVRSIPYCRFVLQNPTIPLEEDAAEYFEACRSMVDDGLRAEAYWDLRPKFEGEVSMLNFLFELKDFRDIAKFLFRSKRNPFGELSDALAGYKQSQNVVNRGITQASKYPFLQPTKFAAQGQLVNSFAIQPLIKDLKEIFKQLHSIVDEAERLFLENGKGTRRYWSKALDPVSSMTSNGDDYLTNFWVGTQRTSYFTVKANMTYNYTPRDKFNQFCTYWGFVPTAEAIWNCIPFSFLADYWLSVAKSLKRMRTDPNLSNYHVLEYSESISCELTAGRYVSFPSVYYASPMGIIVDTKYYSSIPNDKPVFMDGGSCSYYQRKLGAPYWGPAIPKFKIPNTRQMLNMTALARCMLSNK